FIILFILFFFFSSRRRHTRWPRDWSSDVCSSDLATIGATLHDPDHDGKVYASEFEEDVKDGLRCTFDLSGQITAEMIAYAEIDYFFGSQSVQVPITPKEVLLDFSKSDSDCYPERFEPTNDTPQGAPYLGVAPGIHLDGVSLSSATDVDWY